MSDGSETQETSSNRAVCVWSNHKIDTSQTHVWMDHCSLNLYLCPSCQTCLCHSCSETWISQVLFIPPTFRLSMASLVTREALTSELHSQFTFEVSFMFSFAAAHGHHFRCSRSKPLFHTEIVLNFTCHPQSQPSPYSTVSTFFMAEEPGQYEVQQCIQHVVCKIEVSTAKTEFGIFSRPEGTSSIGHDPAPRYGLSVNAHRGHSASVPLNVPGLDMSFVPMPAGRKGILLALPVAVASATSHAVNSACCRAVSRSCRYRSSPHFCVSLSSSCNAALASSS